MRVTDFPHFPESHFTTPREGCELIICRRGEWYLEELRKRESHPLKSIPNMSSTCSAFWSSEVTFSLDSTVDFALHVDWFWRNLQQKHLELKLLSFSCCTESTLSIFLVCYLCNSLSSQMNLPCKSKVHHVIYEELFGVFSLNCWLWFCEAASNIVSFADYFSGRVCYADQTVSFQVT